MKERIKFIDISRAFAMMFIVLGHTLVHSEHCGLIFKLLYSFHVIMFFIISGYTFKIKENDQFIKYGLNKFVRIMVPYFIWALLFLIPYMLFGQNVGDNIGISSSFDLKTQLLNVLYGNGNLSALKQNSSLWFLPALFSIEILYYFIIKLAKRYQQIRIVILIPLILISYVTNAFLNIFLPWGLNTALVLGIFFYIGYLLKEYNIFDKNKLFDLKKMFPILLVGLFACYFNDTVSCIDYFYGNLTLTILSGLTISLFMIYISSLIKENKIIEYIGKNTMGILIFHKLVVLVFQTKLGYVSTLLRDSNIIIELILTIIVSGLSIICSLIVTKVIKSLFPILIGENRINKN